MARRSHYKKLLGGAVALTIGIAASACGSSDDTGDSAAAANTDDCVSTVKKAHEDLVAAASKPVYPTEKINRSAVSGKEFWNILQYSGSPAYVTIGEGFAAAAESLGGSVTTFDGKGNPATWIQGIQNAVAADADGIMLTGIDPAAVQGGLAAAEKAGIPVVLGASLEPDASMPAGVSGIGSPDSKKIGQYLATAAAFANDCKVNALIPVSPDAPINVAIAAGTEAEFEKLCPSTCKTQEVEVPIAEIGTKMQSSVQTALQRDPDVNTVVTAIDFFNPPVLQAINATRSKAAVFNFSPMGNLQGSPSGIGGVATAPSSAVSGWFYFYNLASLLDGKSEARIAPGPLGVLDADSWSEDDPSTPKTGDPFADYESQFASLWSQ